MKMSSIACGLTEIDSCDPGSKKRYLETTAHGTNRNDLQNLFARRS
jgi:hypothetical protein